MHSLDEFATAKLGELERSSLRRALVDTTRVTGIWLLRNGRRLLLFCCNDYLNLTHHPAVKEAAIEALRVYGVGAGASRFVTGNHPLFSELESRLARLKGMEAACVFGSGYLANLGIIPSLVGPDDRHRRPGDGRDARLRRTGARPEPLRVHRAARRRRRRDLGASQRPRSPY